ncbi:glycoside hydrolase family 32 protein [Sphingobacterium sp. SYP-B4668]|uniref:glycoside hydrolase family 32 protein n=1 Tax=Sphingobacterium sp. SYP-B4668 TaxID=2996035 RepID=UPI0005327361|nr:glycoside hydrolase family 32 protein [Sphingobacterium sp. SYP-B4668]
MKKYLGILLILTIFNSCQTAAKKENNLQEKYRPSYHFSPKKGWMNDPNGMVYLDGTYHLFFQHNPDTTVWGPMHWGHATSTDLIHWEEHPIALFPDSLGTIFSGSAVIDKDNTAGFGKGALVAIFTHHNPKIEEAKTGLHQYQSIAYSLDKGKSWTKYVGNPVLPNPGIWDFRDPKVMWHAGSGQWVMTLATKQSITFYGSKNLKEWTRLSEFGNEVGAHGGVWECPDLLRFETPEGDKWVLLVSINPGGPNTGSATQYFVGDFDGTTFRSDQKDIRWMDYGPDNYAGVTFSNTENRQILMGWMSNWAYANTVPASSWRSGMTIPRTLSLQKVSERWLLVSTPITDELGAWDTQEKGGVQVKNGTDDWSKYIGEANGAFELSFALDKVATFDLVLSNGKGDELVLGFDEATNQFFVDRSKAGDANFSPTFIKRTVAPRILDAETLTYRLLVDRNSVEIFADGGLSNLSSLFFVEQPFDLLMFRSSTTVNVRDLRVKVIK